MMISLVRKRYKELKLSWKLTTKLLCFVFFLFLVWFILDQVKTSNYFPIDEVKIAGVKHEHQEMQKILLPLVNKGFFHIDVQLIRERLLQFPWVADASVRRVWPNQVVIQVTEKKPLAHWNHSGLLTTSGEIFNPAKKTHPEGLPHFIGPEGEHMQMLDHYTNIIDALAPLNFKITKLELTQDHSLSVTLNNGIKLNAGYKDILTRISHFVKVYPKIVGDRADEVEYIDLRYSNGMAVRWKA